MSLKLAKRLVEPDYWTCPHGVRARPEPALTYGPEVADVNAAAGFAPDPQQELGLDLIFAINPDGSPASFSFCVICCRQNLKTGLFLQAAIGWLFVLDIPEIAWSAHEMSTSRAAQRDLERIITEAPHLSKRLKRNDNHGIYTANGEERIELADGATVWFKARTRDGGRGLAKPKLILDEAFALKASMLGSLLPILLAQVDPQVLYGSSAGKADSAALFDIRERGRNGTSPRMSYIEWLAQREDCADAECRHPKDAVVRGIDCALDRPHLIRAANPTITTGRITLQTIADLRQELPPEEYMRECLGWWDEPNTGAASTFGPGKWESCGTEPVFPQVPDAIGIAVSVDRMWCSIAAASVVEVPVEGGDEDETEEVVFVAAVERREDVDWVIARAKEIQDEYDLTVVIDEKGPAADLEDRFDEADVAIETVNLGEYAEACSDIFDRVRAGRLRHPNSAELNAAVEGAEWRWVNDRRVWGRKKSVSDVSMLEAATLAAKGALDLGGPNLY